MIEVLPIELWKKVLKYLNKSTKYSASLACSTWRNLLSNDIPRPYSIHINLDASCSACVKFVNEYSTYIAVCQCRSHHETHNNMISMILNDARDRLTELLIEDSLINKDIDSYISQKTLSIILSKCGTNLKELQFSEVDFTHIQAWCLAFISIFKLNRIVFKDCQFPVDSILNESFLIRCLTKSFEHLTHIEFTNSDFISDKFGMVVAKSCIRLEYLNINECKKMTSLTVIAFCENLQYHLKTFINIHMVNTKINCTELQRQLVNPLLHCGPSWEVNQVILSIGFRQPTLVLKNRSSHLLITLYV
uniref:F-box domain-containing protein n=1 Tax=Parastrongyloides trichosuri TaxID=131310 RepID=A0A0N5A274_PARTI